MDKRIRILIVANQDWFFLSHRLPLARALRSAGAEVVIVAGDSGKASEIMSAGFEFVPMPISRKGLNPFGEWRTVRFLQRTYGRLKPDIVHHVTIKPVLYGSIAARLVGEIAVVNAISGLGYAFTSSDALAAILRPLLRMLYRLALNRGRATTIFQNPDDMSDFVGLGLVKEDRAVLIRGSGVDCTTFHPTPEPTGRPVVLLPARMIWDKGVGEFVEVARLIKARNDAPRFVLVGAPDPGNPRSIPLAQMEAWSREGVVEWWGQRADMPAVLAQASIVVLPTVYGEGVPKILLEAAAAGRPIVATDIRGCREIVRPDKNGFLVPPRDRVSLVSAIECLLASADLRAAFGRAGRYIAETEFSEPMIVQQQLAVFKRFWPMNAVRALT